jgi:hypothetical protein
MQNVKTQVDFFEADSSGLKLWQVWQVVGSLLKFRAQ